jgi:hypothetical protein
MFGLLGSGGGNYFARSETTQIIMWDACFRQVEIAFMRPFSDIIGLL